MGPTRRRELYQADAQHIDTLEECVGVDAVVVGRVLLDIVREQAELHQVGAEEAVVDVVHVEELPEVEEEARPAA